MKKILLLTVLLLTTSHACFCMWDIMPGFMKIRTDIGQMLQEQANEIRSNLIPEIRQNIADIRQQNEVLKKLIKAEKEKAIQLKQINFALEKINYLE